MTGIPPGTMAGASRLAECCRHTDALLRCGCGGFVVRHRGWYLGTRLCRRGTTQICCLARGMRWRARFETTPAQNAHGRGPGWANSRARGALSTACDPCADDRVAGTVATLPRRCHCVEHSSGYSLCVCRVGGNVWDRVLGQSRRHVWPSLPSADSGRAFVIRHQALHAGSIHELLRRWVEGMMVAARGLVQTRFGHISNLATQLRGETRRRAVVARACCARHLHARSARPRARCSRMASSRVAGLSAKSKTLAARASTQGCGFVDDHAVAGLARALAGVQF